MNDEIVQNVARLIARVRWLETEHDRRGYNAERSEDVAALSWALGQFYELYPEEFAIALVTAGGPPRCWVT
jgi:hypothetical protein